MMALTCLMPEPVDDHDQAVSPNARSMLSVPERMVGAAENCPAHAVAPVIESGEAACAPSGPAGRLPERNCNSCTDCNNHVSVDRPRNASPMFHDKRILIVIGGGIAAYKTLELIRLIRQAGNEVTPVLTKAGERFVTPLSVAALAGNSVNSDLFDPAQEAAMGHIALSRSADLVVVAPATADLLARMANGIADDLASTLLLATDTPVLAAPAMNVRMWQHAATRRNVETLTGDGIAVVGPETGDMACGEHGPGRMAEPETILNAIDRMLAPRKPLPVKVIITSGPTREAIDPVRFISNRSSGRQGTEIARAFADRGAEVAFITGPADHEPKVGARVIRVESAEDMLNAVTGELPADVGVFAAAVADWRAAEASSSKIKKTPDKRGLKLDLVENPDILASVSGMENRPGLVVGFAAETDSLESNALAKLDRKGCDWIVANDVSESKGTFGGEENEVRIVTAEGIERWPRMPKSAVAARLVEKICNHLAR